MITRLIKMTVELDDGSLVEVTDNVINAVDTTGNLIRMDKIIASQALAANKLYTAINSQLEADNDAKQHATRHTRLD